MLFKLDAKRGTVTEVRPYRNRPAAPPLDMQVSLKRAIGKAYSESAQGRLDAALEEVSRWQRKETIARNKLAAARAVVQSLAQELAKQVDANKGADDASEPIRPDSR